MANSGLRILTSPFTYPIIGTCNKIYHEQTIEVYPSGNLVLEDTGDIVDVTRYAPSFVFDYNLDYLRNASYTENLERSSVITEDLPVTLSSWSLIEPSTRDGYKQFAKYSVGSESTYYKVYFTFFSNNTSIESYFIVGSSQSGEEVPSGRVRNPNIFYDTNTAFYNWLNNLKTQYAGTSLSLRLTVLYFRTNTGTTYPIFFNVSQMLNWDSNETARIVGYARMNILGNGQFYLDLAFIKRTITYIGNAPEQTKLKSLSTQATSWINSTEPTYDQVWDYAYNSYSYIYSTTQSIYSGHVELKATIDDVLYTFSLAYLDTSGIDEYPIIFEVDTTQIKTFLNMVRHAYEEGELDSFVLEFVPNERTTQESYTAGIDGGLVTLLDEDVVNRISGSLTYYETPISGEYHTRLKLRLDEVVDYEEDIAYIDVCPAKYYVLWEDRAGGFQCQPFKKTETYSERITRTEYATYRGSKELASVIIQPSWKVNSDWIDDIYYPYYESILVSPHIELWDTENKVKYDVRVEDSDYTEKTFKNQSRKLFNLELTLLEKEPKNILY